MYLSGTVGNEGVLRESLERVVSVTHTQVLPRAKIEKKTVSVSNFFVLLSVLQKKKENLLNALINICFSVGRYAKSKLFLKFKGCQSQKNVPF